MSEEARARIVAALAAPDSPLRRQGAELVVDHVLDQPVGALVDLESLRPIYRQALTRDNVQRAVDRMVLPGITRVRDQLADAGERVGDGLPEAVRERIVELASNPRGPKLRWLRGALDAGRLRDLFAPVMQETLLQFVRSVPGVGAVAGSGAGDREGRERGGRTSGLVGRLGREMQRGTGRLMSVGRSVADGLGVDLEGRVQETAREFSQGAMAGLQRGLRERLESDQGREILSGLARSVVDHVMATPVATILDDLDRLPLSDAVGLAPDIIAAALERELVGAVIEGEIAAWFEREGLRSLRELLDEAGLLEAVRALAVERVHGRSAALFASDAFGAWLERVLAEG